MTPEAIRRHDPADMYGLLQAFPAHWREGRRRGMAAELGEAGLQGIRQVLVMGMGGSAIGGDLLRTLAGDLAAIPVHVSRGYHVPAWVGAETLGFVSSYSGNTEETLQAMEEAQRRGARLVCLTTGGALLDKARQDRLPHVVLPGGMPPRAAIGYALSALLTLAERVGLFVLPAPAWTETNALLDKLAEAWSSLGGNEALGVADRLHRFIPVIYSASGLLEAVNVRWRNQLHENAKIMAFGNYLPEMNHNEIAAWGGTDEQLSRFSVVVLRDPGESERLRRRVEVTRSLVSERAAGWNEVQGRGESRLARMLSLAYLGDWVSFYLAMRLGVDPTPIPNIDRLKAALHAG